MRQLCGLQRMSRSLFYDRSHGDRQEGLAGFKRISAWLTPEVWAPEVLYAATA